MGKLSQVLKSCYMGNLFPKELQVHTTPILYSKYISKPSLTWSRSLFPLFCFSKPSCSIYENRPHTEPVPEQRASRLHIWVVG